MVMGRVGTSSSSVCAGCVDTYVGFQAGGVSVCSRGLCQSLNTGVRFGSWCTRAPGPANPVSGRRPLLASPFAACCPCASLYLRTVYFLRTCFCRNFFWCVSYLALIPEKIIVVRVESWYWRGLAPPVQIPPVTRVLLSM